MDNTMNVVIEHIIRQDTANFIDPIFKKGNLVIGEYTASVTKPTYHIVLITKDSLNKDTSFEGVTIYNDLFDWFGKLQDNLYKGAFKQYTGTLNIKSK